MDLFDTMRSENRSRARPLAARMRPRTLDEFVGQEHFLGEGKLLRRMLLADRINSLIFYGPPGCGKTALAHVIANHTKSRFKPLNAVSAGIKDVRELLAEAKAHVEDAGERTILFIDEIHRFNRSQQDVLLPDVEDGVIVLIGATTQNPFFAINTPLLSRSQIFTFEALTREHTKRVITRALKDTERGLGGMNVTIADDALAFLCEICDGDARRALTALEIAVKSSPAGSPIHVDLALAQDSIQRKVMNFDPTGDAHYDLASAFIKSMRGSDPNAAVYWLARMLEGGEDPRFIARRLVIFASEDVGNADPRALVVTTSADAAFRRMGLPEGLYPLTHAAVYLACAPKSNAIKNAWQRAKALVEEHGALPVPMKLRNPVTKLMKQDGYGAGYKYAHDHEGAVVPGETYLPEALVGTAVYEPTDQGEENRIRARLAALRAHGV